MALILFTSNSTIYGFGLKTKFLINRYDENANIETVVILTHGLRVLISIVLTAAFFYSLVEKCLYY